MTSVDVDGFDYIREGNFINTHSFYGIDYPTSITLSGDLQAWGDSSTLPGIDTLNTAGMLTHHFLAGSSFIYRITQEHSGICDATFDDGFESRQHSIYVKDLGLPIGSFPRVGNMVWDDLDADGIQDEGEPGLQDVTFILYKDSNGNSIPGPGTGDFAAYTTFTKLTYQQVFLRIYLHFR